MVSRKINKAEKRRARGHGGVKWFYRRWQNRIGPGRESTEDLIVFETNYSVRVRFLRRENWN